MPSVMTTAEPDLGVDRLDHGVLGELRRHEHDADTSAPVSFIASSTVPKTVRSLPPMVTVVPALRAFTPPTMFGARRQHLGAVLGALARR